MVVVGLTTSRQVVDMESADMLGVKSSGLPTLRSRISRGVEDGVSYMVQWYQGRITRWLVSHCISSAWR